MNSIKVHEKYTHLTPFIKSLPNLFKNGKAIILAGYHRNDNLFFVLLGKGQL